MLSKSVILTIFFTFVLTSTQAFWDDFKQKETLVKMYKECREGGDKYLCRGIFGKDCISGGNCDFFNIVKETDDAIIYVSVDLEDLTPSSVTGPEKNMVYMIGFSPFETIGTNVTAKCKSKITLKDFKFFIYQSKPERKRSSFSGKDTSAWNKGEGVFGRSSLINKTIWEESCREKLDKRNYVVNQYGGRPITEYQNVNFVVNNEFVLILRANYKQSFQDSEKLVLYDGSNYKSTDGVLFTNFENKELPDAEKKYQVPDSEFSSSTIIRASRLAMAVMMTTTLFHVGF